MSDYQVRLRKLMKNPLLKRRQFVSEPSCGDERGGELRGGIVEPPRAQGRSPVDISWRVIIIGVYYLVAVFGEGGGGRWCILRR